MIQFNEVCINELEDYNDLLKALPDDLLDDDVVKYIIDNMGLRCDKVTIEYPYYDKDYLSTYYIHYSQKFKRYNKECCRLHFEKQSEYFGYITIHPGEGVTKIGKTYLDPRLLIEKDAYLMVADFRVHISGQEFNIKCFPWKKQQTDIDVCAHTSIWGIIRYYGTKHKGYIDATIGDIVEKVDNTYGRKTPSVGLNVAQMSDLLKKYNFSPLIIDRNDDNSFFKDTVLAYIESGIPLVGFLEKQHHAVSIVGHGKLDYSELDDSAYEDLKDSELHAIPHTRFIDSIYVMDDRLFPYKEVEIGLARKDQSTGYGSYEIQYAIAPLYERMQLTYIEVRRRVGFWFEQWKLDWPKEKVCRIYITSANSLREKTYNSKTMNDDLKDVILTLPLPRFVWCVDIASVEEYKNGLVSGRILIDTTSATFAPEPWILRHGLNEIQYRDNYTEDDAYCSKISNIKPYAIYENNLNHYGGKNGE